MNKILAVIITYNPDIIAFRKNLRAIYEQNRDILIYDNASSNMVEIEQTVQQLEGVVLVKNDANIGLPINYNRAARYGKQHGYTWLLIFDQDTSIPADFLSSMIQYMEMDAAIICPKYRDVNLAMDSLGNKADQESEDIISEVKYCISSGSMNRISTILECGGFDEKMFIDQIDHDYCRNVVRHGKRILQVNGCCIDHSIGNARYVNIFGKRVVVYNHSAFRKYYLARNLIYQIRKWKLTKRTDPCTNWMSVVKFYVLILLESNKLKKYIAAFRGGIDGLRMTLD